ncbi:hypothetical protein NDU88_004986 [Pleurodeles waltl]|uniref:Uncharacterized protein n=1 Tax=Pleurodeles waltl TaxID=8319 RepID=A0AAV7M986_PLEWA|nr:hypothetical protein NDU88_004986 [Pleurodeles waltl]
MAASGTPAPECQSTQDGGDKAVVAGRDTWMKEEKIEGLKDEEESEVAYIALYPCQLDAATSQACAREEQSGVESRRTNTDTSRVPERSGAESRRTKTDASPLIFFWLPRQRVFTRTFTGVFGAGAAIGCHRHFMCRKRVFSSDKYGRLGSRRSNLVKPELLVQEADFWGGTPEVLLPLIASTRFIGRGGVWRRS